MRQVGGDASPLQNLSQKTEVTPAFRPVLRVVNESRSSPHHKFDFDRWPSLVAVFANSHCRLEEFSIMPRTERDREKERRRKHAVKLKKFEARFRKATNQADKLAIAAKVRGLRLGWLGCLR